MTHVAGAALSSGLTGRARRAPPTRRARGRRPTVRRPHAACFGSPPNANATAASSAGINSRSSRGGGKYSSSSVTRTASTPCTGASFAITASTRSSGALAPAVTPTIVAPPSASRSSSSGPSTRSTIGQPASRATFVSAIVFDEFALPMTTTACAAVAIPVSAVWRLVVAKQRSLRDAVHSGGNCSRVCVEQVGPFVVRERRLRQHRDAFRIVDRLRAARRAAPPARQPDRVGRDREGADGFVVAGVADVEDREALAGADLRLVVHLGDERAHRVDDVATLRARGRDDLGRASRGRRASAARPAAPRRRRRRRSRPARGTGRRRAGCARSRGSSTRAARTRAPSTPAP